MATRTKRRQTKIDQREARGKSVHLRGLARSVDKFINRSAHQKESNIKAFREMTMGLPKEGKARIYPKTDPKMDCSGRVVTKLS